MRHGLEFLAVAIDHDEDVYELCPDVVDRFRKEDGVALLVCAKTDCERQSILGVTGESRSLRPALQRAYGKGCYRGREGVETFGGDTRENWEELRTIAEEFRDLVGDRVLLLGRQVGRGKGSGAQVETPLAAIFDFRGDRVSRFRAYFDRAEGLGAAGLSE
jgi:ketosteroid isomerase-like protein